MFKFSTVAKTINSVGQICIAGSEAYYVAAANGGDAVMSEIDQVVARHLGGLLEDLTTCVEKLETVLPQEDAARINGNLKIAVAGLTSATKEFDKHTEDSACFKVLEAFFAAQLEKKVAAMAAEAEAEAAAEAEAEAAAEAVAEAAAEAVAEAEANAAKSTQEGAQAEAAVSPNSGWEW